MENQRKKMNKKAFLSRCLPLVMALMCVHGLAMAQHSVYVKMKPQLRKNHVALKAGARVSLSSLPLEKAMLGKYDLAPEAVSVGICSNAETQGIYRLECANEADMENLLNDLALDPAVEYVEKVPVYKIFMEEKSASPNDPYYQNPQIQNLNLRWHLDMVNAEEAWGICKGNPSIKAAIIDNAVWGEHEDLQVDTSLQYNAVSGEKCSAPPDSLDNTQYCDGTAVYEGTCNLYNWSHGTHSAGLVGAINDNGKGIASVAGGITLMGVSCGIEDGIDISNVAEGLSWAVEHGAKLINMSFGSTESSRTEHAIIKAAAESGVVIVAASGNDGVGTMSYPAAYPEVIAVGSCDYDRNISEFSNFGGWVDVLAPGGYGPDPELQDYIFSTTFCVSQDLYYWGYSEFEGKHYDRMMGTSMAAPVASSVCALLLSYDSTLDYRDIRSILMASAQPSLTAGIAENSGIVDAAAALRVAAEYEKPYEPAYLEDFSIVKTDGNVVPALYWSVDESASKPACLRIYRDNLLIKDNLDPMAEVFYDSTARGGWTHCYEICEVDAEGKESYRIMQLLTMPAQCNLYLMVSPEGAGTVKGSGMYEEGSSAIIVAKPNPGWKFDYWNLSGQVFNENDSISVIVGTSARLTAMFSSETGNEVLSGTAMPKIRLVPNPADEAFVLQGVDADEVERVMLLNMQGSVLESWPAGVATYVVEGFDPGIYMVAVSLKDGRTRVLKLVVR